jgi:hypothetical protein
MLKGISETRKVCNGLNQENFSVIVDKLLDVFVRKTLTLPSYYQRESKI